MAQLNFTIQNPQSKSADKREIYVDKTDKSNLQVGISQPASLGIPTIQPSDSVTITFAQSLLQGADESMMVSDQWEVTSLQQPGPGNANYQFTLQPKKPIAFGDNTVIIFFQNLQGKEQTNAEVSVYANISGSTLDAGSTKLFVIAYPDQTKELSDNILRPAVYINEHQKEMPGGQIFLSSTDLNPPIANRIHLNLKFAKGELVEKWDSSKIPFFNISFSYGSRANDLTNNLKQGEKGYNAKTSANNMVTQVQESNYWQVQQDTAVSVWRIEPTSINHHLFTSNDNNLDILIDHVISNLSEGEATIYIQWGNIPGYNPGWKALDIPKVSSSSYAGVLDLTAPGGLREVAVGYKKPIHLNWSVFAATQVQLTCKEDPDFKQVFQVTDPKKDTPSLTYCGGLSPDGKGNQTDCNNITTISIIPKYQKNSYYLQALNSKGVVGLQSQPVKVVVTSMPAPNVTIQSATITDDQLTLQWEVKAPPIVKHDDIEYSLTNGIGKVLMARTGVSVDRASFPLNAETPFAPPYYFKAITKSSNACTKVVIEAQWETTGSIRFPENAQPSSMVMSPDGSQVFVYGDKLYRFNVQELPKKVENGITVDSDPKLTQQVIISPDGKRLYMGYGGGKNVLFTLSLTNTEEKTQVIPLPGVDWLTGALSISPDGKRLYFLADQGATIGTFTTDNLKNPKIQKIKVPDSGIWVKASMQKVFVNNGPDKIGYFNAKDLPPKVVTNTHAPQMILDMSVADSLNKGFVISEVFDNLISTFSLDSPGPEAKAFRKLTINPQRIALSASGAVGLVCSLFDKAVAFFQTQCSSDSPQVIKIEGEDPLPYDVAMHPIGHIAFCANHGLGTVQVFKPTLKWQ